MRYDTSNATGLVNSKCNILLFKNYVSLWREKYIPNNNNKMKGKERKERKS